MRRTALIVGEGLAEEVFLSHLKHLVAQRGQQSIAVKSAKGKGGRHVLDVALRQWRVADYDRVAVLLDTDTDWDDAQRARARKAKVEVFESSPCLEAMLLSILKRPVPAATKDCKRDFEAAGRPSAPASRVRGTLCVGRGRGGERADARAFADLAARRGTAPSRVSLVSPGATPNADCSELS
ncbi:hypothetical protein [Roseateles sp.]|uniref:hypothetical protein n=1 Tax=Roseateles sp. TaxID=1971397 RepID=UPI0039565A84